MTPLLLSEQPKLCEKPGQFRTERKLKYLGFRQAAGEKDAFRELYGATSNTVYGFALSILRSRQDAEDVMHDAYIRIYNSAFVNNTINISIPHNKFFIINFIIFNIPI